MIFERSNDSNGIINPAGQSDTRRYDRKANTKLRKRGEEWRDAVYVDDAPINGPNLYVILSCFHDPDLPQQLINAGVPLRCLMRIKRPGERLARGGDVETRTGKLYFLEEYSARLLKLYNFWTKLEERSRDPVANPELCDVGFLVFSPPRLDEESKDDDEALKKDTYDRVSCILYDFYDLYRQHGNYLRSMRLEGGMEADGSTTGRANTQVYETLLDGFPTECVSVPLILFAILTQVEANERGTTESSAVTGTRENTRVIVILNLDAILKRNFNRTCRTKQHDVETEAKSETTNKSSAVPLVFEEKIKSLDIKYNLEGEERGVDHDGRTVSDIKLILHEDSLLEAIRLLDDSAIQGVIANPTDLIDNILPIFRHPVIVDFFQKHGTSEEKSNEYTRHIDNIRRYFDGEVSDEEVRHHLHVLMFDGMMSRLNEFETMETETSGVINDATTKGEEVSVQESPEASLQRSKSLPSFSAKLTRELRFLSDGNIDYGRMVPEIVRCSPLFDLIDPRELLAPGYLARNVFEARVADRARPEDFTDVQLLPEAIFLQLVHRCLAAFDRLAPRYFEPTDSLLLCFYNDRRVDCVHEEERTSIIRTPVRLRDFCEYVVPEERDWLRREEELHRLRTVKSMERLMRRSSEIYEETMLFCDEDFVLPGTLKARDLQARRKSGLQDDKDVSSNTTTEKTSEKTTEKGKKKKRPSKGGKKKNDKSSSPRKSVDVETSSLITGKVSPGPPPDQAEREPVYDFVGYDLGRLRVQVTNRRRTFRSVDDTLVRVEVDDWLYKAKHLRITVTIRGHSLRLSRRIDAPETDEVFHLTSRLGIILAFQKLSSPRASMNRFHTWQDTIVEHRISWPTGLLIESVVGDGPDNPYYIRQSYTSRGYVNSEDDREICRKFLRNGTVLKYLHDGRVIVLRPNGNLDVPSATDNTVKVSRYTVLNDDGRVYEVVDDLVVSEHHRLLVRTASDYEVDEKFTRRADGTNVLLNSNGELIVRFPDGTRITTGYTIEKEPVTCDWTEEEVLLYFATDEQRSRADRSLSNPEYVDEARTSSPSSYEEKINELLIRDSFVSVLLTCRAEHKNYAAVSYDQSAVNCTLSMPDDLRVSISRRGHYEVSMADGVNLKIDEDSLSFKGNTCTTCGSQSTSKYNFSPFDSSAVIFTTTDVFGNVFEVTSDGKTHYSRGTLKCQKISSTGVVTCEEVFEEDVQTPCNHETLRFDEIDRVDCRLFAINRDLTAYEYVHRFTRNEIELTSVFDREISAILYGSPRRPALRRLITFEPVGSESRLKNMLSFPDCQVKPTNYDRRDMPRSTYSTPYDWLFPFGRNGNGIWKNIHELPLMGDVEALPELLSVRILRGFKEPGGNAVIDLQRALGRYWTSLVRDDLQSRFSVDQEKKLVQEKTKTAYDRLEDSLHALSLGTRKTIDVETYKIGLERQWQTKKSNGPRKSMKHDEFLGHKALEMEELEWQGCSEEYIAHWENVKRQSGEGSGRHHGHEISVTAPQRREIPRIPTMKIRPAIPVTSQSPYNEFHVHQFLGLALSHPRTHENRTLYRCRWVRFGRWSWNKPTLLTPL
ncbi:Sperm-associated antigen 17 [Melipona quadrifasciata]|uniref:Sperm-associated antigen 17 n=1 Tax=Melipona quadrifasciata TaxID=166423 RepID=A0A0N0U698_9HYME|nr:Sperm-associated antigen 17 [Melipona quadrifasciata]